LIKLLYSKVMSVEEILFDAEERMEKALAKLKQDLTGIRTGRANPGMVDSLRVEAYGSPVPIKQIASVSAPEPQQLVIRPYDPGTIKDIEKGIIASDLGLAPQSDGKVIRLNIPALSGEVRRKMVARTKELAEETKVAVRNIRRDANKQAEVEEKDKDLTEDERDSTQEEVQKLTKKFEDKANDLAKAKEAEVMED
jgi:ribosome recycling factor